jgi:hypothetical protein
MQAEATFSENSITTSAAKNLKIVQAVNLIEKFKKFIEESNWDEQLLGYEKHLNRFFWWIIAASIVFFAPVCVNIFTR